MKKTTCISAIMMTMIIAFCLFVTPAQAATSATSAVKQRSAQQTELLVDAGDYYGWTSSVKTVSEKTNSIVTQIKLRNSKWSLTVKQTTARSNNRITTTFKIGKKAYSINAIKSTLKKYAVAADKRVVLEDQAAIQAESLTKYATKYGWTVADKASYKSGKAYQTVTFTNSKYKFTAVVSCFRKSGKIATSYLRDSKNSTAKAIKSWLKTYKQ